MNFLSLDEWISTVFVDAIGVTFLHSLWQALIALLLCYGMLSVARKARPVVRYNLLLLISILLAGAIITTFFLQFRGYPEAQTILSDNSSIQNFLQGTGNSANPVLLQSKKFIELTRDIFNKYLDVFVATWFIIFCFKWLRLTLGINYIKRITRFESTQADHWQNRFSELKTRLGITKPVKLLQSNLVKVPMATGFIKPVIIVPASLLSNIPVDMVESILLHELAHIRRRDYLVNVLQSAAETIFFFNPFILTISGLIREEREACCDEIAVNVLQNKKSYVEALMAFGEYSSGFNTPALAFPGNKNYLLQRVKRILYNQNKKMGVMEKSILFFSVILLLTIAVFTTAQGNEQKIKSAIFNKIQSVVTDTIPDDNKAETKKAIREVEKAKKQLIEAQIKEQKSIKQEMQKARLIHEGKPDKVKAQADQLDQLKYDELEKTINKSDLQRKAQELAMLKMEEAQINLENIKAYKLNNVKELLEKHEFDLQKQELLNLQLEKQLQVQQLLVDSITRNIDIRVNTLNTNNGVDGIISFLQANGFKKDEIKSFTLNSRELVVNDKKQLSSMHSQLKERFIKSDEDYINYSTSKGTTTISIHRSDD